MHLETTSSLLHLVVCHHGLWGNPAHVEFLAQYVKKTLGKKASVRVWNSRCNVARLTYDGVDACGDRLSQEILQVCSQLEGTGQGTVSKLTLIGYSLGGLIVRYAAGRLYADRFFDKVEPVNFVTIASPHLGCREKQNTAYGRLFNSIVPWTLSRTGCQLTLNDKYSDDLPLLYVMSDPAYCFFAALQRFKKRVVLANTKNDSTVPYCTAAICRKDPYAKHLAVPLSPAYPMIVRPSSIRLKQGLAVGLAEPRDTFKRLDERQFLLLLPVILPLWLLVLGYVCVTGVQHYVSMLRLQLDRVWCVKNVSTEQGLGNEHSKQEPSALNMPTYRARMIFNLNILPWDRIDVDTKHYHAHAAIVIRSPDRFEEHVSIIDYLVRQLDV